MINLRDWGAELWDKSGRITRVLIAIGAIALAASLPFLGGTFLNTPVAEYESVLVFPIAIFVIMALGLNIVIGKSGLLDLGYVAFFAIGAYTMGLLGTKTGLNSWEILPIGIAMAMFAGLILGVPALRLRGDYLAIITLGFGEIVRITALNLNSIGGANGIIGIPTPPTIFGLEYTFDNHRLYYWTFLIIILLTIWMIRRLSVRRGGRAWESIRQDEDAAELMGVPTFKYKICAFILSATLYPSKICVKVLNLNPSDSPTFMAALISLCT